MASREFKSIADLYENPDLKRIFKGHKAAISKVAVHPEMKNVASCSVDSNAHVWQFKPDMRPYKVTKHVGPVLSVNYNPTGSHIITAGQDKNIIISKVHPDAPSFQFKAHAAAIRQATFSDDENYILSCSDDKSIKVWDVS